MEDMPTIPGQDPEIMTSAEIAVAKRRKKLNELLQHGDPFTGRFICSLGEIACIAKEIVETERMPRYSLGRRNKRSCFEGYESTKWHLH